MSLMRTYRRALRLSQSAFAAQLNVPRETYRPWDAGRREPPAHLLTRARTLAGYPDETVLLPLPVLRLPLPDHVHGLVALDRSPRRVEFTKALLGLHASFDRSMIAPGTMRASPPHMQRSDRRSGVQRLCSQERSTIRPLSAPPQD